VSTILALQIDKTWATVGLYALALTTPLSRVYDDQHWLSDVVMGSVLGYYSARTIWSWHKNDSATHSRFSILPTPRGIVVSMHF